MKLLLFTITGCLFSLSVFAQTSFHFYFGKAASDPAYTPVSAGTMFNY